MKDPARYETAVLSSFPVTDYLNLLQKRRDSVAAKQGLPEGEDFAVVGVTDHNVCRYASELAKHAWEERKQTRIIVLPGMELEVTFHVPGGSDATAHLLCIFSPCSSDSDIRIAVHDASQQDWTFGSPLHVQDLPSFVKQLRGHSKYPAICIAAHISSSKGLRREVKRSILSKLEAEIARLEGALEHGDETDRPDIQRRLSELRRKTHDDDVALEVLRLIGACGFDGLQVSTKQDENHYRRLHRYKDGFGRAVPIVCSDAHRIDDIFRCDGATPYVKVLGIDSGTDAPGVFRAIRDKILALGETRFSYTTPGQTTTWISGIEIAPEAKDAVDFWPLGSPPVPEGLQAVDRPPFIMQLSRNLNCLIGGRGSGKSAALEAIGFVCCPKDDEQRLAKPQDQPDWHKRARATLQGCQIRVCWQFAGPGGDLLPKRALFISRYFDPSGRFAGATTRDIDGKELLPGDVPDVQVQLFRMGDIEREGHPENLRSLFDQICGNPVIGLETQIKRLLHDLQQNRASLLKVAAAVSNLVRDGQPLREYARRKRAYTDANQPSVQEQYSRVDQSQEATGIARQSTLEWEAILNAFDLPARRDQVLRFFKQIQNKLSGKDFSENGYCTPLRNLFDSPAGSQAHEGRVLTAIDTLDTALTTTAQALKQAGDTIQEQGRAAKDDLARAGLPAGGQDREAKKKDFEDAERALESYRAEIQTWSSLMQTRDSLFGQLKTACQQRTSLRKETAETITARLSRDLDGSVLVIEADAQPVADRKALQEWLEKNVEPHIPKYKHERIQAIMRKGVTPEDLRRILLGPSIADSQVLRVEKEKAADGAIPQELANAIIEKSLGIVRLDPELPQADCTPELWRELPLEVREGLWSYPPRES